MKYPRLAISAMAAVHMLLFFVLLLLWEPGEGPLWIDYSYLGIVLSQGCLFGLWAALGSQPTPWRATFIVIIAAAWGWFTHTHDYDDSLAIGFATIFLTGQTFQVMGILLLARFLGFRLSEAERGDEDHLGHLQFSIGQALSWMTALAVFMGATHYLYFLDSYFDNRILWLPASGLAVGLASMWLMLGSRRTALRCFTLLAVIGLGTGWNVWLSDLPWGAFLLGCEAAITAASLLVVRLAGYRLVWHWPFRHPIP